MLTILGRKQPFCDGIGRRSEVFATLYRHLGIDVASVKLPDFNGRPQYLLEHRDVIRELI